MTYPAWKYPEPALESADRLSRLETHAEHFQAQLAEVKDDVNELKDDVRELRKDLAALALSTERSFAATHAAIATLALSTEKSMSRVQVGFLMTGAGLLAVIARAFHWL